MEWISSLSFELLTALLVISLMLISQIFVRKHRLRTKKGDFEKKVYLIFKSASKGFPNGIKDPNTYLVINDFGAYIEYECAYEQKITQVIKIYKLFCQFDCILRNY
jgi:hypothetical protein